MNGIELVGYLGATLTTCSFLPQMVRVIKTKSTEDLSIGMFSMMTAGTLLWLVYGILLKANPIILANLLSLAFCLVILFYKLKAMYLSRRSTKED